ncbi:MAG: GvpL/GvpF family gas vesicle protein, partial [Myxococcaceae bacterium]
MPEDWTPEEVRQVVAQARAEAREEVVARLRERYVEQLLAAVDEKEPPVPEPAPDRESLWYAFGVVAADAPTPEPSVRKFCAGELAVLVEPVDAAEFSEEGLRRNLEQMPWVEATARRHDAMLKAVLPEPVVPFPMATVFQSQAGLRDMLARRGPELERALAKVRGHVEVGARMSADPQALRQACALEATGATGSDGSLDRSGAAYVRRRLDARHADREARRLGRDLAHEVHDRLAELAVEARQNQPRGSGLDAEHGWTLLNGAYLVPLESVESFDATLGRL